MKPRKLRRILAIMLMCITALMLPVAEVYAKEKEATNNRFNVVIVLDASGSMKNSDPQGFRYEAINQFTNLLAEQGNVLGGIVFHSTVAAERAPSLISSQKDKDAVMKMLRSSSTMSGWTNTGAALTRAVEMIKNDGNPRLPSVIVFLSDGNTEMGTSKATQAALKQKAEAIQAAREENVAIYSICLNADHTADTSEMQQISDATGGVFQEVSKAEDLQNVFNSFYDLIYRTSTITLVDKIFPESGQLETEFDIPGIGVEEVNIIIYGNVSKKLLRRPDGTEITVNSIDSKTFSMLKLTDVVPGTWTLITEGITGDSIKINMVYNTNLKIEATLDRQVVNPADSVTITAKLKGNEGLATDENQYVGYAAILQVMDAYGQQIETVPMQVVGECFEIKRKFAEGVYYYKVVVTGNHIEKESAKIGPLTSTTKELTDAERNNTAPTPVQEIVEKKVYIWPFVGGKYTLDMNTLATDAQDQKLRYIIVSSSFIEGTDYTVSADGMLKMNHFSLSKGAFTISATDSGGLSCEVEVIIKSYNIGLMALIGMIVVGLIVAIVFACIVYFAAQKPWSGMLTVRNVYSHAENMRGDFRGPLKLKKFNIGNCGIDGKFVPLGRNRLEFVSKRDVYPVRDGILGRATKHVSIMEGAVTIYATENQQGGIHVETKPTATRSWRNDDFSSMEGHRRPSKTTRKNNRPNSTSNPFS